MISPVPFVEVGDSGAPADIGGLLQEETEHIENKLAETTLSDLKFAAGQNPIWSGRIEELEREFLVLAGEAESAEARLRSAYEADPDNLELAMELSRNLVRQARADDAEELLPQAVDGDASRQWVAGVGEPARQAEAVKG